MDFTHADITEQAAPLGPQRGHGAREIGFEHEQPEPAGNSRIGGVAIVHAPGPGMVGVGDRSRRQAEYHQRQGEQVAAAKRGRAHGQNLALPTTAGLLPTNRR